MNIQFNKTQKIIAFVLMLIVAGALNACSLLEPVATDTGAGAAGLSTEAPVSTDPALQQETPATDVPIPSTYGHIIFVSNRDGQMNLYMTSPDGTELTRLTVTASEDADPQISPDGRRIAFASTGSVYGEPEIFPTPETAPFPIQTSLYGASKLAGEGLIEAYCEGFGFQGYIFRFVSILGERYTHGHVFDFYRSLRQNPHELRVLGNGRQRKSYLYVQDCIDAMWLAIETAQAKVNIFNLGTDEYCEVDDSIKWITGHLGLTPQLEYTGGERGWVGDSPFIFLDCRKIRALGWAPKVSIREGVIRTLEYLLANPWVLERRA